MKKNDLNHKLSPEFLANIQTVKDYCALVCENIKNIRLQVVKDGGI